MRGRSVRSPSRRCLVRASIRPLVGLEFERGVIVIEGRLEFLNGQPRIASFHEPTCVIRYELEGSGEVADCLFVVGHPLVDLRSLGVEFRVIGVLLDRLAQVLRRLVENSKLAVDGTAVVVDLFVSRVRAERPFRGG